MSGHRDPRCSYTVSRGVHCRGQLNAGDHPKYRQKPPIAVVIFSEHVEVNRGDGCSNEGSALAVLYILVFLIKWFSKTITKVCCTICNWIKFCIKDT